MTLEKLSKRFWITKVNIVGAFSCSKCSVPESSVCLKTVYISEQCIFLAFAEQSIFVCDQLSPCCRIFQSLTKRLSASHASAKTFASQ